jgi:hypothetical protein
MPSWRGSCSRSAHAGAQHQGRPILLISSDEPTVRSLGFALKHGRNPAGDLVVLESHGRGA